MKKNLKHVAAIVLLVGFAVFALGSMGSSPKSPGGGSVNGSKGTCSKNFACYVQAKGSGYMRCGRDSCLANRFNPGQGYSAGCNCEYN